MNNYIIIWNYEERAFQIIYTKTARQIGNNFEDLEEAEPVCIFLNSQLELGLLPVFE